MKKELRVVEPPDALSLLPTVPRKGGLPKQKKAHLPASTVVSLRRVPLLRLLCFFKKMPYIYSHDFYLTVFFSVQS